jgi:hypothetical protein
MDVRWYRSGYAEFDRRAVGGLVQRSDVELGALRATELRLAVSSKPHGGDLRWTRWRVVILLFA